MRWICLAALLAAGCDPVSKSRTPEPSPAKTEPAVSVPAPPVNKFPPDEWTHKEMVEFLNRAGVKVTLRGYPTLSREGRVAALLSPAEGKGDVLCYVCKDEKAARDEAGAMGAGAFYKGRFAVGFLGSEDSIEAKRFLERIALALK